MKKRTGVFVFSLLITSVVFSQGIRFEKLTYKEALAKAKTENKLVFVDCHASWCAPCKQMAATVFPLKKTGDYFNAHFINVEYDIEKEGKGLAKEFSISSVPVFLLITPEGELRYRLVGAYDADAFLDNIIRGSEMKNSLDVQDERYRRGEMSDLEFRDYIFTRMDAGKNEQLGELVEKLLRVLSDDEKTDAACWRIFSHSGLAPVGSENFTYLCRHKAAFEKNVGRKKVNAYLSRTYNNYLNQCFNNVLTYHQKVDLQMLMKVDSLIAGLDHPDRKLLSVKVKAVVAVNEEDIPGILAAFKEMVPLLPQSELNGQAYTATNQIGKVGTKADLKELVKLGDLFIAAAKDDQVKTYIDIHYEPFRKRAADGVYFDRDVFKRAVEKAKLYKRPLFIYLYDSENQACREMDENILADEKIGERMKQLSCVKYDVKTVDGRLAMKHCRVKKTPACLLLDQNGAVLWKKTGMIQPDDFLTEVGRWMRG